LRCRQHIDRVSICNAYNGASDFFGKFILELYDKIVVLSAEDVMSCINLAYETLLDILSEIASYFLGSYYVDDARKRPDHLEAITRVQSETTVLRMFKRSQRACAEKSFIHSRCPSSSPMDDAFKYFSDMYRSDDYSRDSAPFWNYSVPSMDDNGFAILNSFSVDAVKSFIQRYPKGKSCGIDSIHICIMKSLLESSFPNHLSLLYRVCVRAGYTPEAWNLAVIFPVPKVEDARFVNEFRPISLTSMLRRCFEGILLQTLTHSFLFSPLVTFSSLQGGFRKGFSTLSHAMLSNDGVHLGVLIRVFIDLKNAYDRVSIRRLLEKLRDRVNSPIFLSLIGSLFISCSNQIVVNGELSPVFSRVFGLFQGSLLSPLLFDVYIDDLARQIEVMGSDDNPFPPGLLFADDIQLMARGVPDAQSLVDVVVDWCSANNMLINCDKSGFTSLLPSVSISANGEALKCMSSYKYLGFPQSPTVIDWSYYVEGCVQRGFKLLSSLQIMGRGWPVWVKLALYRSFVRSILEYGAPLLWHHAQSSSDVSETEFFASYQKLQDQSLVWVFGVKGPLSVLHSLAAIPKVVDRFLGLATLFIEHVQSLDGSNPVNKLISYCQSYSHRPLLLLTPRTISTTLLDSSELDRFSSRRKLAEFIKKWSLEELSSRSVLCSFVLSCSRLRRFGVDKLLYAGESIRSLGFSWRCNHFKPGAKCYVCDEQFNRGHVNGCDLLVRSRYLSVDEWEVFRNEYRLYFQGSTYCILDSLLNNGKYELFELCFKDIQRQVVG
jgi:hypothetical protein